MLDLNIEKIIMELNEPENDVAKGGVMRVEDMKSLTANLWQQLKYKESLLLQKSRVKWIAKGDFDTLLPCLYERK